MSKPLTPAARLEANLAECRGVLGRYALYGEIAHGGMATVHLGRLLGPVGFSRTVAIKRLHPQFARDPDFVTMFLDEARLAARIRHPNVVPTLDVIAEGGELFLVMEYVAGESLARLLRLLREKNERTPPAVAVSIMCGVLAGLHAAHEATTELGEPLELVHRDMSPQNIMVCLDGIARVLDFGIAKAAGRSQTTRDGQLKGKLSYIAPEQLRHDSVDRRTDIYAAGVTLWEILAGQRLFRAESEWQTVHQILEGQTVAPSSRAPEVPPGVDAVVLKALAKKPEDRFATARDMAIALEAALPPASLRQVGEWIEKHAGDTLRGRAARVAEVETTSAVQGVGNAPGSGRRGAASEGAETLAASGIVASGSVGTGGVGTGSAASVGAGSGGSGSGGLAGSLGPSSRPPATEPVTTLYPTLTSVRSGAQRRRWGLSLVCLLLGGSVAASITLYRRGGGEAELAPAAEAATATSLAAAPAEVPAAASARESAALRDDPAPLSSAGRKAPAVVEGSPRGAAALRPEAPRTGAPSGTRPPVRGPAPAVAPPSPASPAAAPAAASPQSHGDECNPPYTVDAAGIRHPKAQCL